MTSLVSGPGEGMAWGEYGQLLVSLPTNLSNPMTCANMIKEQELAAREEVLAYERSWSH